MISPRRWCSGSKAEAAPLVIREAACIAVDSPREHRPMRLILLLDRSSRRALASCGGPAPRPRA